MFCIGFVGFVGFKGGLETGGGLFGEGCRGIWAIGSGLQIFFLKE